MLQGDTQSYKDITITYLTQIVDGTIPACKLLQKQAKKLLHDFETPYRGIYTYNADRADIIIDFIRRYCCQIDGQDAGKPIELQPFQVARLACIFGFVDNNGNRRYKEVMIVEARKNGKTTETVCVALAIALMDAYYNAKILFAATSDEQACIMYDSLWDLIQASPLLIPHFKHRKSDIYFEPLNTKFRKLSSNAKTKDGFNGHFIAIDELAAHTNRKLYDLLKQSTGAKNQVNALIYTITTNGEIRDSIYDAQITYAEHIINDIVVDDHFLPLLYMLDDGDDWQDEANWVKTNPGLNTIRSIESVRDFVAKAKQDTKFQPTVMMKDFNIVQTGEQSVWTWDDIDNTATYDYLPCTRLIGGMDAAERYDLTAAVILCVDNQGKMYIQSHYWLPADRKDDAEMQDKVPYKLWEQQGLITFTNTSKVSKLEVLEWFKTYKNRGYRIEMIGYDKWHVDDSEEAAFKRAFGEDTFCAVKQNLQTVAEPVDDVINMIRSHEINYNNNPIFKWCLRNTTVRVDVNGNAQFVKKRDKTQRIDGVMAFLDAYVAYQRCKTHYMRRQTDYIPSTQAQQ